MSNELITVWSSDDGNSTIVARRLDDGIELISNDEEAAGRVWFPGAAAPMLAGWLMAPFEGPTPFARATKGLRAVADALEQVEAELHAALSYDLIDNVRKHIENSLATLRMGEKLHDVPVNTGSRLLLALGLITNVHQWLSGIAPQLRVHQVDTALKMIEQEHPDLRNRHSPEPKPDKIVIVFDGPPSHAPARFVEIEDGNGKSINIGEWSERDDGLWALTIER
jgi:hypothetical protein